MCMYIHMCVYTCRGISHGYVRVCTWERVQANGHVCRHVHGHEPCSRLRDLSGLQTCMSACEHASARASVGACVRMHARECAHVCMCVPSACVCQHVHKLEYECHGGELTWVHVCRHVYGRVHMCVHLMCMQRVERGTSLREIVMASMYVALEEAHRAHACVHVCICACARIRTRARTSPHSAHSPGVGCICGDSFFCRQVPYSPKRTQTWTTARTAGSWAAGNFMTGWTRTRERSSARAHKRTSVRPRTQLHALALRCGYQLQARSHARRHGKT